MKQEELKQIFNESCGKYAKFMESKRTDYHTNLRFRSRKLQVETLTNLFDDIDFPFEKLNVVETGASYNPDDGVFGLIFGFAVEQIGGTMFSIDVDGERLKKSKEIFNTHTPSLDYQIFNEDSVKFLRNLSSIPNFVHLDSWDLNMKNPFPSALHGWREFVAIESKMESGSVILIDDNYLKGSWLEWIHPNGNTEKIEIEYPIIGKGGLVYHYVKSGVSDWNLVGDHPIGRNIKITLQKK